MFYQSINVASRCAACLSVVTNGAYIVLHTTSGRLQLSLQGRLCITLNIVKSVTADRVAVAQQPYKEGEQSPEAPKSQGPKFFN